jgi:hypothetical protein
MIRVDVFLPDPAGALSAGAFGAGALIRIDRSDLVLGVYGAYAEVQTVAIVSTTVSYQWWDAAGVDTSLYRYRLSNAGDTVTSAYSQTFAGVNPAGSLMPVASYATLAQVLALSETPITQPAKLQRLTTALGEATDELNKELRGRDYFRHPVSASDDATNAWYLDGDGTDTLCAHIGIPATPSKLEVSWDLGQTFVEIASGSYFLVGDDPASSEPIPDGEPWFHVRLPAWGPYPIFPKGRRTVRVTGAYGWPAVPPILVEAVAQRARQIVYGDANYEGGIPSDPAFGPVSVTGRWPFALFRFLERERSRFFCSR